MSLQEAFADSYVPRSDILRGLETAVSEFDQLDTMSGLRIYRLLHRLQICQGEEAASGIEAALHRLERALLGQFEQEAIEAARAICLALIRAAE